MAGETGGTGRDLPLRAPLISFPGWDPGGPVYNENEPFLLLWDCFSAIAIVVYAVLGLLRHLWIVFLGGPQGLVSPTSGIISPALTPVSLLSALQTKEPAPSARVPPSQGWVPDPAPPPPLDPRLLI